jgi:hypothetical protein
MTPKAWYWTGLGLLAISIGSSGAGRCWMGKASEVVDHLRATGVPYMAMTEMAIGRTQAGMGHMQAATARIEAQRARLNAAQGRIEANRARLEAVAAQRQFEPARMLANYVRVPNDSIEVPDVSVSESGDVVEGTRKVIVCPRTHIQTVVTAPLASASEMEDPI